MHHERVMLESNYDPSLSLSLSTTTTTLQIRDAIPRRQCTLSLKSTIIEFGSVEPTNSTSDDRVKRGLFTDQPHQILSHPPSFSLSIILVRVTISHEIPETTTETKNPTKVFCVCV